MQVLPQIIYLRVRHMVALAEYDIYPIHFYIFICYPIQFTDIALSLYFQGNAHQHSYGILLYNIYRLFWNYGVRILRPVAMRPTHSRTNKQR